MGMCKPLWFNPLWFTHAPHYSYLLASHINLSKMFTYKRTIMKAKTHTPQDFQVPIHEYIIWLQKQVKVHATRTEPMTGHSKLKPAHLYSLHCASIAIHKHYQSHPYTIKLAQHTTAQVHYLYMFITNPGVQYPHWLPFLSATLTWIGWNPERELCVCKKYQLTSSARKRHGTNLPIPSTVVIVHPSTEYNGHRHWNSHRNCQFTLYAARLSVCMAAKCMTM